MATQAQSDLPQSGPPQSARPTGTVAFLFSDIEGSTLRWEARREAMAAALARHDVVMRAALETHGAYIFKTLGDAFCAAFPTAYAATAAALEAQRALAAEDFSSVDGLRVRIALHAGSADERDGDYFGPVVNRVARLLAIGHGGQVLLSDTAAQLLGAELPAETTLLDLGDHRLKDLSRPERVFQIVAPGLQDAFPPLRSLDRLSNNLPAQLTSFVGRESVVADIKTLIEDHRLVTLIGAGGAGKTRCALQAGADVIERFEDGVWFVELAPLSDASLVGNAVAKALNVQEQAGRPIVETLAAQLKRKRLLLILDNCEHLIDQARQVVSSLLRDCPDVRILATSREPLALTGEQSYRIPSLEVPSDARMLLADETTRYGAVQLFIDRAHASDRRFEVSQDNVAHIADICRRLDGIPLAIELAAARIKVLSPKQLVQKLDERFRVLTGGDRSALPRHQTMRALIDWSYDLLSDDERATFRKVSIFAGGFTLDTAVDVCGDGSMDEIAVLDVLASLVDKSLVQTEVAADETRYRLLESTRQYAHEKLAQAGEEEAAARAHAHAYLRVGKELDVAYDVVLDRESIERSHAETENFRAALSWAFGPSGDPLVGQRLAGALRSVWDVLGAVEGLRWLKLAQQHVTPQTPTAVLAEMELAEARIAGMLTRHKASLHAAERALSHYRALSDPIGIAQAQLRVGRGKILSGEIAEGEEITECALATVTAAGFRRSRVHALESLALARALAGDIPGGRRRYSQALAAALEVGAERWAAQMAISSAELEFRDGGAVEALALVDESLRTLMKYHVRGAVAAARCNQAAYLVALRRYDDARHAAREALADAREQEWPVTIALTLQHLAAVAALRPRGGEDAIEDLRRAARLLGYVDALLASLEALREYTENQEKDATIAALREALDEDALSKLIAEGSRWSEEQAIAEGTLI